jgi:hypothetical protein
MIPCYKLSFTTRENDLENSFLGSRCGYILLLCVATFNAMKCNTVGGRDKDSEALSYNLLISVDDMSACDCTVLSLA